MIIGFCFCHHLPYFSTRQDAGSCHGVFVPKQSPLPKEHQNTATWIFIRPGRAGGERRAWQRTGRRSCSSTWRRRCRDAPAKGSRCWNSGPFSSARDGWWRSGATPPSSAPRTSRPFPPISSAVRASAPAPCPPPRPSAASLTTFSTCSTVKIWSLDFFAADSFWSRALILTGLLMSRTSVGGAQYCQV